MCLQRAKTHGDIGLQKCASRCGGREIQLHELGHVWDATGSGVPSQNSHAVLCIGFLRVTLLGESDRPFIKLVLKSIPMLFYIK